MKKHRYISLLVCGLLIGLAATSASAQSKIRVNVPFDFTIGDRHLQAGQYLVQPASSSTNDVLLFRNDKGSQLAIAMGIRIEPSGKVTQPKLVFNRYGEAYFLSQVWMSAGEAGSELRKGNHERELARSQAAPTVEAVVASAR